MGIAYKSNGHHKIDVRINCLHYKRIYFADLIVKSTVRSNLKNQIMWKVRNSCVTTSDWSAVDSSFQPFPLAASWRPALQQTFWKKRQQIWLAVTSAHALQKKLAKTEHKNYQQRLWDKLQNNTQSSLCLFLLQIAYPSFNFFCTFVQNFCKNATGTKIKLKNGKTNTPGRR